MANIVRNLGARVPTRGIKLNAQANNEWKPRMRSVLEIVTSLAVIVAASVLVLQAFVPKPREATGAREIPLPNQPVSLVGAAFIGSPSAPAVMLEFSDFECPFCAKFTAEVLPILQKRFIGTGRLLLAFRNLPGPGHQHAQGAAMAAACAADQAKFEPLHDLLFANPKALDPESVQKYAIRVGLAGAPYTNCIENAASAKVKVDVDLARSLGVTGTPAFFIGTLGPDGRLAVRKTIRGKQAVDEYVAAVDQIIAAK